MLSDAAARASFLRVFIPDVAIASSTPLEPKGPPQFPGQKEAADFVDHFRGPPNAHIVVDLTTREQDIIGTNLLRRLAATGTSASPQFSVPYVPFYGASMDFSCRTQAGEHVIVEVSTVGRGALLRAAAKYGEQDVAGEITRVVVVNIQDARMRLGALEPSASTANEKKNKNWSHRPHCHFRKEVCNISPVQGRNRHSALLPAATRAALRHPCLSDLPSGEETHDRAVASHARNDTPHPCGNHSRHRRICRNA